ncbi:MAG: PKD domain-containing protein [Chloroflexi bacterium]|nr:PKD domain-containing protein [Chloroflexota bacterium]
MNKVTVIVFMIVGLLLVSWTIAICPLPGVLAADARVSIVDMAISGSTWGRTYGGDDWDGINSIVGTGDGGYIAAGYTRSFGAGDYDVWILKLDASGVVTWEKAYGGSDHDVANVIQETSDGGFIVAGQTESFGAGMKDAWVMRLNRDGSVAWQKTYGDDINDYAFSVQETSDGGFIVAGLYYGSFEYYAWVLKLGSDGSIVWHKTYENCGKDAAYAIQEIDNGQFIVAANNESGTGGVWVLKLNGDGTIIWQNHYGTGSYDTAQSIQETSDGGFVIAGYTIANGWDAWLMKLTSDGTVVWNKAYGGPDADRAHSFQQTSDGGFVLAGYTHSFGAGYDDAWVLKLAGDGMIVWEKTLGGSNWDIAHSIQETSDGGFIMAGRTLSSGAGNYDAWVLKLDSTGEIPGCSMIGTSNAVVTNRLPWGEAITVSVQSPVVASGSTFVLPLNTLADTEFVCTGPYTISGQMIDGSNPIPGVAISVGVGGSAKTDTNGYYSFVGLSAGTYTLTPAKIAYTFSPPSRVVTVPPDLTAQDFTGTLPDTGFRPDPDGYSFSNRGSAWGSYPLSAHDFQYEDMIRMFGQDRVCWMVGSTCIVKPTADWWHMQVNWGMNGGHCDGMSSTSLRFFEELDAPSTPQDDITTTHDLELGSARRHIAYYHVLSTLNPVAAARSQGAVKTPSQVLADLGSALSGGASDPPVLSFATRDYSRGHTVSPYAIEDRGSGVYWVHVYDSNHPNDTGRHTIIDTIQNTWSYDLDSETWDGDLNSHNLAIVPISIYAQQPELPTALTSSHIGAKASSETPSMQVWLIGHGHLLITDSQGQRIGYAGDHFVNEIAGAYVSVHPGGSSIPRDPIYTLPLTNTYTILLDGQTLTQTETTAVSQFGPGYAAWVSDVTLGPTSQYSLTFAPDGVQLAYRPNESQEATLALALDDTSASHQLQIEGADIEAGKVVTLTVDERQSQLVFDCKQASDGQYDLKVKRVSEAGEERFFHSSVVISATDTHYSNYGSWRDRDPMALHIDHGSNGSIDETILLENQAVQAAFTAHPTVGTAPLTVVFTNTSAGDYTTNLWDFGDGMTNTQSSPTYVYAVTGSYTVTLTASGPGDPDSETKPAYITVYLFGDLDHDCDVDVADIMQVTSRWNTHTGDPGYNTACDLDHDGDIDVADIMQVAAVWGQSCE